MTNRAVYDRLLQDREKRAETILVEAEKHYRQALANYETAKRDRAAWMEGNNGIYTKQENDGTRDTVS